MAVPYPASIPRGVLGVGAGYPILLEVLSEKIKHT